LGGPKANGGAFFGLFLLGSVASMWISNILIGQRPKY
jgi:hypothetical protein